MREDLVGLLSALVATDSVNPSLVPGGAGEARIAAVIADWAREVGLGVDVLEATPGRPSVVVRAPGRPRQQRGGDAHAAVPGTPAPARPTGGRTLLLCGHIDTVTVAGMDEPFSARVDGDRLYGRGAYDMKAGVAAALLACRDAAALGLAGDVVVAAVADEEHASLGVQEALGAVRADAAIVTEPTELEVAVAHKGFVWAEIDVAGRAAHGSRPHLGADAIVRAGPVLTGLGELDTRLAERTHPLLGRPSVHASLIAGGDELSSYPASCRLSLERRTLPGETAADVEAELDALIDGVEATRRITLVREPFEIAAEAEIVGLVRAAASEALGTPPAIGGASYWADAAFIAAAGIPTVLFGPGGEGAHAATEWVSLGGTDAVADTLVAVARRFCA
jgi:acetylornithine deacetylase